MNGGVDDVPLSVNATKDRRSSVQFWLPVRVKLLTGLHRFTYRRLQNMLRCSLKDSNSNKNGMTRLIKQRDMFILLPALRELCSLQQL